jgi:DNA (cytosine-5)-methyltransferase 1
VDFDALQKEVVKKTGRGIDVVMGGPPCQGFSRANMRTRSSSNPLNKLVSHFIRAVKGLKPHVAVLENVADLEIFQNRRFVEKLKSQFENTGYQVECRVLTASDFGVPQRRRRFFLIAVRDGLPILFPKATVSQDSYITVWDSISDLPKLTNGNRVDDLAYCRNKHLTHYQIMMRKRTNGKVRNNYVSENSDLVIQRYAYIPQGGNWRDIPDHLMDNYKDKHRCHNYIYRRLREEETSIVITHFRKSMLIHPKQDRGLSVREAARIQSFPDHFIFKGPLISQQQQVANAVPPLLAKAVAQSVKKMLKYSTHES